MNLLEILRQEIENLQIEDKMDIASYIYVRTGEIFQYNPLWEIGNQRDIKNLRSEEIDIQNITNFYITCFSWSKIYKELLKAFKIPSVDIGKSHAKVQFYVNKTWYIADITKNYEDITRIKFKLPLKNFPFSSNYQGKPIDDVLKVIKKELLNQNLTLEEYTLRVCKLIENIMQFPRENIGFVSGREFIEKIFKFLLEYTPESSLFFDKERQVYVNIYTFSFSYVNYYFSYQKMANGYYEFHEIDTKELCYLLDEYSVIDDYALKLIEFT